MVVFGSSALLLLRKTTHVLRARSLDTPVHWKRSLDTQLHRLIDENANQLLLLAGILLRFIPAGEHVVHHSRRFSPADLSDTPRPGRPAPGLV